MSISCAWTSGSQLRSSPRSRGGRTPDTTSSPCAFARKSPEGSGAPVSSSRENATPLPLLSPRLPKTICCTLTAVPHSSGMRVDAPVGDCTRALPRVEHGTDRLRELLLGLGGKLVETLELARQLAQR